MGKHIKVDKNELFKYLVENCSGFKLTQLDEDYIMVSCKKHGETKRLYGRYTEKLVENACIFCEVASAGNEQKFLERSKLEYIEDFELGGFVFDYFIPELSLVIDKRVKAVHDERYDYSRVNVLELSRIKYILFVSKS